MLSYEELKKENLVSKEIIAQLDSIFTGFIDNLNTFIEDKKTVKNPIIVIKDVSFNLFNKDEDTDLFYLRNILAYTAICINDNEKSERNPNKHHDPYYNSSLFDLVIQGFTLNSDGVAYSIR